MQNRLIPLLKPVLTQRWRHGVHQYLPAPIFAVALSVVELRKSFGPEVSLHNNNKLPLRARDTSGAALHTSVLVIFRIAYGAPMRKRLAPKMPAPQYGTSVCRAGL